MARWIALDYGKARTGIAVTDDQALIASPLETVATPNLRDRLSKLILERPCTGVVLGVPGQLTDSSEGIEELKNHIRNTWPHLTLSLVDESFTSREARSALVEGGMKKSKRQEKGNMDKVAAALILQRFLDHAGDSAPGDALDFSALRRPQSRQKR